MARQQYSQKRRGREQARREKNEEKARLQQERTAQRRAGSAAPSPRGDDEPNGSSEQ